MKNIFVYGSLMYDAVWKQVVLGKYQFSEGTLHGYERIRIQNEVYPGLRCNSQAQVKGRVWLDVSALDVCRLNEFEGDYYDLADATALTSSGKQLPVTFYMIKPEYQHILDDRSWDQSEFESTYIQQFIKTCLSFDQD